MTATLDFTLAPELEAHEPPEARGLTRDGVRLLVGSPAGISHHRFTDLPDLLHPGDVLVVNTSATIPAAIDTTDGLVLHVSTHLPTHPGNVFTQNVAERAQRGHILGENVPQNGSTWVVELRQPAARATTRYAGGVPGQVIEVTGGARVTLLRRYSADRLWVAAAPKDLVAHLMRHGRPIRYSYVERDWPLEAYRSVFATDPGSAEMPSASRPFTETLVTRLVSRGVVLAPITLHTGVASPEAHERPYPERFEVPAATARLVTQARAAGQRVIAVGTTAVRAIETATRPDGSVTAAGGFTDLVIGPDRPVRVVNGLLTGFHEPKASHLLMLAAIAGPDLLADCYREAIRAGYLWHEFGDLNLLLS